MAIFMQYNIKLLPKMIFQTQSYLMGLDGTMVRRNCSGYGHAELGVVGQRGTCMAMTPALSKNRFHITSVLSALVWTLDQKHAQERISS